MRLLGLVLLLLRLGRGRLLLEIGLWGHLLLGWFGLHLLLHDLLLLLGLGLLLAGLHLIHALLLGWGLLLLGLLLGDLLWVVAYVLLLWLSCV